MVQNKGKRYCLVRGGRCSLGSRAQALGWGLFTGICWEGGRALLGKGGSAPLPLWIQCLQHRRKAQRHLEPRRGSLAPAQGPPSPLGLRIGGRGFCTRHTPAILDGGGVGGASAHDPPRHLGRKRGGRGSARGAEGRGSGFAPGALVCGPGCDTFVSCRCEQAKLR